MCIACIACIYNREGDDGLICLPDGFKKEAPNPGPITNTELLVIKDDHSLLRSLQAEVRCGGGLRLQSPVPGIMGLPQQALW